MSSSDLSLRIITVFNIAPDCKTEPLFTLTLLACCFYKVASLREEGTGFSAYYVCLLKVRGLYSPCRMGVQHYLLVLTAEIIYISMKYYSSKLHVQ